MTRELELKLEVEPEALEALRSHPLLKGRRGRTHAQLSVYFDTKKNSLRKAGYSLRVRQTKSGFVQTIKPLAAAAGLFDRDEWESPVPQLRPDADAAAGSRLEPLLTPGLVRKLGPVVRSDVERTVWLVKHRHSKLEVILDEGKIRGGDSEQRVLEVEIELRKGKAAAVVDFARSLGKRVPVRLGVLSKAERGFALADGSLSGAIKAGPTKVDSAMTVAQGFAAIVHSCLKHFRLNEPLVVGERDPAALHQARVAMRRLRSALSLFKPAIEDKHFQFLRDELRWFTGQLGEARNLDVFLDGLEGEQADRVSLQAARERAYAAVIEALQSQRFRDLLLDLVDWVETGEWRRTGKAARPLDAFAKRRIDRLWNSIEKAGGRLVSLDEEPRHRLRIAIKKLRYGLEFTAALHQSAGDRQKRFMRALTGLQEGLGHLNDLVTARAMRSDYPAGPAAAEAGGRGAGDGQTVEEEAVHLKDAQAKFARLRRIGPFWQ